MTGRTIVASALALVCVVGTARYSPSLSAQSGATATQPAAPQINLNTATAVELEKLPGVGPAMATRIIEYREKNEGFKKIEELMNVQGIGERRFLELKSQVTVTPLKTDGR